MLYDTIEEYDEEIKITKNAIRRVLLTGQTHNSESGTETFDTTEVQLTSLRKHLSILVSERNSLMPKRNNTNSRMVYIGAGF